MKNLWTVLPPLLADNFGFLEAVNVSDGCGVVDDSGEFRLGGHNNPGRYETCSESSGYGSRSKRTGVSRNRAPFRGTDQRNGRAHSGARREGDRVAVSGVSSEDVITGTQRQILEAFEEIRLRLNPQFVLFSAGPCGAMIGTDLEEIAEIVSRESGLPAAAVNLTGQKPYDIGLSRTLEAMAKLLTKPMLPEAGTANLLGGSTLDWAPGDIEQAKIWVEKQGLRLLAQPGSSVTAAQLETMAKAQVNLVTTVSGLAAAWYLQTQFGTPYVAMAPFGTANCQQLLKALDAGMKPESAVPQALAEALIIGEQLTANAIRTELEALGAVKAADVATFYSLDKTLARPHDHRIRGEDDARTLLMSGGYRLVVADPLLRCFAPAGTKWVDLRHRAFNTYGEDNCTPVLTANHLNVWLDRNL